MAYQYKRQPLTLEEVEQLERGCRSGKDRLVICVLLDTGLRISEFSSLTRESVHWQNQCIEVVGKGGPFGSKSKRRLVPLSDRARKLLEAHFAGQELMGIPVRTVDSIIRRVAGRTWITKPVSAHVLRHTYAITCVQKGFSLPAIQKLLGHDHLLTTQIYLNLSNEEAIREFREKW